MESIKHKMDTMVKEKDAAIEKAMGFEAETAELEKAASKFEKEVDEIQRKIAKVEDQLDIAMSSTKETADKLEIADKESIDAELQVKKISILLHQYCSSLLYPSISPLHKY